MIFKICLGISKSLSKFIITIFFFFLGFHIDTSQVSLLPYVMETSSIIFPTILREKSQTLGTATSF